MSFSLKRRERIHRGIKRVAEAELDRVRRDLRRASRQENVHNVRKGLKKLRALLRLVRSDLDPSVFDRENTAFRDVGRQLATLRDADVLVATVKDLEADGAVTRLRRHQLRVRQEFFSAAANVKGLESATADAAARLKEWTPRSIDRATLIKGLRKSYRRASDAFRSATRSRDDERWHEWRKRTKDVYHHLQFVQRVWPPVMRAVLAKYKELSRSLGVDHDLVIVRQRLADVMPEDEASGERKRILAIVRRRRRKLHESARKSGRALFDEKPRVFAARFAACLDSWRS